MKFPKYFNYIILFSLSLTSCVSLNTHQTGRTLGRGNYQYFTNVNYGSIESETNLFPENENLIISEVGFLTGITDKIDLGLKTGNTFKITGMSKFQIIGDKESLFASSLATDIGIGPFEFFHGIINYHSNISFINSIHPNDFISFTLSPKYVLTGITTFNFPKSNDINHHIYGYTTGIIIGRKTKISIEIAQFTTNKINLLKSKPFLGLGLIHYIN